MKSIEQLNKVKKCLSDKECKSLKDTKSDKEYREVFKKVKEKHSELASVEVSRIKKHDL